MSDQTVVIDLTGGRVELEAVKSDASEFVHRIAVADAANALLLALNGSLEAAGVIMLARALGCQLKQRR
jgi:hypothetical protein